MFIGILYRKPDIQIFLPLEFREKKLRNYIRLQNNVILLGDFNCNMMTDNNLSRKIKTLCTTVQMTQVISQPTRVNNI